MNLSLDPVEWLKPYLQRVAKRRESVKKQLSVVFPRACILKEYFNNKKEDCPLGQSSNIMCL